MDINNSRLRPFFNVEYLTTHDDLQPPVKVHVDRKIFIFGVIGELFALKYSVD